MAKGVPVWTLEDAVRTTPHWADFERIYVRHEFDFSSIEARLLAYYEGDASIVQLMELHKQRVYDAMYIPAHLMRGRGYA
jgi:hypothetical protein